MPPDSPQRPIIEHPDVRRMLLRQKSIVEGGLCLVLATARYQDLCHHSDSMSDRARAGQMLDLLTPITKTYCAERGFEANSLAVQVHGGYGYTSEYLPEAWLRDQKLNSIHEGTTGIQSQDLLGRKVLRSGGESLQLLGEEICKSISAARASGVSQTLFEPLGHALRRVREVSAALRELGDPERALSHSADYLDMLSTVVVAWQWLQMATAAQRALAGAPSERDQAFYRGKLQTAAYFFATDLPRVFQLADLCQQCERSYVDMQDPWF